MVIVNYLLNNTVQHVVLVSNFKVTFHTLGSHSSVIKLTTVHKNSTLMVLNRDGVLEDCRRPRGQLEDKKSRPWPRRPVGLALALNTAGLGLEALSSTTWLQSLLISVPKLR